MKEEWRDIEGYEGLYQVSNLGNVKSLHYLHQNIEQVLKPCVTSGGYCHVVLCKDRKKDKQLVHRLVAQAFLPNPNSFPFINHKDENPSNNHVANLEWCTPKYNCNYGTANQRKAEKLSIAVEQLTTDGLLVRKWKSIMDAGRSGYSIGHICNCCKGKRHSHKGYVWRYA